MTFRTRLSLAAAFAVAVAVVLSSLVTFAIIRHEVRGQVDDGLHARADRIAESRFGPRALADLPPPRLGAPGGYIQLVVVTGNAVNVLRPESENVPLPYDRRVISVAVGGQEPFFTDSHVRGVHVRMYTTLLDRGTAMQVTRDLGEVDSTLARVKILLLLVTVGGIGIAMALGLLVAGAALAPVRRLTQAAEYVAETKDLRGRIDARGHDELSRLAASFNTMLDALEASVEARRQLVADASHELRTPLTSLRTNIEVLARDRSMAPQDREALMNDVVDQLAEMTTLVSELVELARGDQQPREQEDVRLAEVVAGAVERARRHAPNVEFRTELDDSVVHGVPSTIDRAVTNLLDNAAKWSPPSGVVDVAVRDGEVIVRDRGPGIAADDLPRVFDRFYRAPNARGMRGSGLGLAIVRQVAEAHGGEAVAVPADGGGTEMRLRFPPNGGPAGNGAPSGNGGRSGNGRSA